MEIGEYILFAKFAGTAKKKVLVSSMYASTYF